MDEFVSVPEFNLQFNTARTVIEKGGQLAEQEERLRQLVPLMDEDERAWANDMIEMLPELTAPPPPPSPLMLEAMEISQAAAAKRGTREEMRAEIAAARKKIWEIADRAPKDEGAHIRGITRSLDHLQEALDDPFWELPESPPGSPT